MTRRPSPSQQTERIPTKAELQRVEERRHVEDVIRKARRVRLPKRKPASAPQVAPLKVRKTSSPKEPPRPLTPAEQERVAERRHVEGVMRNARRSRFTLRRKPHPARSGGGSSAGVAAPAAGSTSKRLGVTPLALALGGGILVLACALLGLTINTVVQNSRLVRDLASLRQETSSLSGRQADSLDKVEQALAQLAATEDKVQASLDAVTSSQGSLESKVSALEAGRVADASQWRDGLSSIEKSTREGLGAVASRMDKEDGLAAAVGKLLPLLQPSEEGVSTQTPSETPSAP